jgi:hypothetical protein
MISKIDERTRKYFDAIKSNIGFLGMNATESGGIEYILNKKGLEPPVKIKSYAGYVNSSNIDIYKYDVSGETRYCAELCYWADIDAFVFETYIFNKMPSRNDIITIRNIGNAEFDINFKGLNLEFDCWECGNRVHWLDTKGSLKDKIDHAKEKFCTMCDN